MTVSAEDRTLILLRHAAAEESHPEGDHERELTGEGLEQARAAGAWLHEQGFGVDEVLCSSAVRAQQTAEGVWDGGCAETAVHVERGLYNAREERLLDVVRGADPEASVVMVVGHAPGVPALASLLADGMGSIQAHEAMTEGFPTAAVAVLSYSGHWSDLAAGEAELERFHVCR